MKAYDIQKGKIERLFFFHKIRGKKREKRSQKRKKIWSKKAQIFGWNVSIWGELPFFIFMTHFVGVFGTQKTLKMQIGGSKCGISKFRPPAGVPSHYNRLRDMVSLMLQGHHK